MILSSVLNRQWTTVRLQVPRFRLLAFFALVLATILYGSTTMFHVLNANGMSPLEGLILVLFTVTFGWISLAFWTAAAGFVMQLAGRDPLSIRRRFDAVGPSAPITARTAIVMPAYNEDTDRVVAGLEAAYLDLIATGEGDRYDFYLLSDTKRPDMARAEERAMSALCKRLDAGNRVFYRRRASNDGRKAGNIAEFCRNWGSYYDFMVVLDADSIMTGQALTDLTRSMQDNPSAGIIQTVPIPVRQETMFGRFMQFAAGLYSPMLAAGMAFWQCETANYWGHNAIIRIPAFMSYCGLPSLPGKPPLGGEILSHDFVEAALMRRSGYHVYLLPDLEGSYEETPGNLLDHAKRDRRWAEGNLQHLRLLTAHGLHPLSRLYFVMGALAYANSFLWLIMLGAGTVHAISGAVSPNEYFASTYQLHPNWQISRTEEMMSLLWTVIIMLFLPKIMAVLLALLRPERRRSFGGGFRLLASSVIEIIFSVLIAPVMMIYHSYFVSGILLGRRAAWDPQSRDGHYVPFRVALRSTAVMTLAGIAWGAGTAATTPIFALALAPVLVGLVLAAPLVSASSSTRLGARMRDRRLFLSPCETRPPKVLQTLQRLRRETRLPAHDPLPDRVPEPPAARHKSMPVQSIHRGPRWDRPVAFNTGT